VTSRRRFRCSSARARVTRRFLVTNCPRRQHVAVGERMAGTRQRVRRQ
jgi:hypothetical protein